MKVLNKIIFPFVFFLFSLAIFFSSEKNIFEWVDLEGYKSYYELANSIDYFELLFLPDGFFYILLRFLSFKNFGFSETFSILHIFTSFVLCFIPCINNKNKITFLFLYFCLIYWLHNYVQVRIALALSFFMIALVIKGDFFILRIILLVLSCFTHFSMLFVIIVYFFCKNIKNGNKFFVFLFLSLLGILLLVEVLPFVVWGRVQENVKLTEEGYFDGSIFRILPLLQVLTLICIIKKNSIHIYEDIFLKMAFFAPLCFYAFSSMPIFATRSSEIFCYFYTIVISKYIFKDKFIFILSILYIVICLRNLYALTVN